MELKDQSMQSYSLKVHHMISTMKSMQQGSCISCSHILCRYDQPQVGIHDASTVTAVLPQQFGIIKTRDLLWCNPIHLFTNSSQRSTLCGLLGIVTFSNILLWIYIDVHIRVARSAKKTLRDSSRVHYAAHSSLYICFGSISQQSLCVSSR